MKRLRKFALNLDRSVWPNNYGSRFKDIVFSGERLTVTDRIHGVGSRGRPQQAVEVGSGGFAALIAG